MRQPHTSDRPSNEHGTDGHQATPARSPAHSTAGHGKALGESHDEDRRHDQSAHDEVQSDRAGNHGSGIPPVNRHGAPQSPGAAESHHPSPSRDGGAERSPR